MNSLKYALIYFKYEFRLENDMLIDEIEQWPDNYIGIMLTDKARKKIAEISGHLPLINNIMRSGDKNYYEVSCMPLFVSLEKAKKIAKDVGIDWWMMSENMVSRSTENITFFDLMHLTDNIYYGKYLIEICGCIREFCYMCDLKEFSKIRRNIKEKTGCVIEDICCRKDLCFINSNKRNMGNLEKLYKKIEQIQADGDEDIYVYIDIKLN